MNREREDAKNGPLYDRPSMVYSRFRRDHRAREEECAASPQPCSSDYFENTSSHGAQWILVDCDEILVQDDISRPAADGSQIDRENQRGSHNRPDGHLCSRLTWTQAVITHHDLPMHSRMDFLDRQLSNSHLPCRDHSNVPVRERVTDDPDYLQTTE